MSKLDEQWVLSQMSKGVSPKVIAHIAVLAQLTGKPAEDISRLFEETLGEIKGIVYGTTPEQP